MPTLPFIVAYVITLQFLIGLFLFLMHEVGIKKRFSKQSQIQKRKLYELGIFKAIQEKIGYTLSVDHVVDTISSSLKDLFPSSVAISLLVKEQKAEMKYYIEDEISNKFLEDVKRSMITSLEVLSRSYLSKDIEESRFGMVVNSTNRIPVASYFHIPVSLNGKIVGIISVASKKTKSFIQDDVETAYQITKQMTTALGKLEEVIQTEEGKLLGMISSLTDGIFMIDKNFNLTTMNDAAKRMLSLTGDTISIFQILSALSHNYDFKSKIQNAMDNNKVVEELEMQIQQKTVQIAITPVVIKSKHVYTKEVIGASVRLHDITAEKEMARLKEDFTSSVVHELRAPLSAIKAGSELMITEKDKLDQQQQEKTLEIIHKQSERMLHDINSLLDAAKLDSGHFTIMQKPENILYTLAESQQLFSPEAEKKHIAIILDVDPQIPKGYFDSSRIGQVVNNLISNALKFTPDGGSIVLHARKFFKEHLPKSTTNPGIIVSVSDTGIGIAQDKQNLLFSKFSQIQNQGYGQKVLGTGLGLYVAKGIVEAHGGSISVESLPGHGTTFSFTLPMSTANVDTLKMETETPVIPVLQRTMN